MTDVVPTPFPLDLVQCDLRDLIKALDGGEITSVSLTKEYIRESAELSRDHWLFTADTAQDGYMPTITLEEH